jgi:ribonuclease III
LTNTDYAELLQIVGYNFSNPDLLEQAMTHKSYANENPGLWECNERLEFLGDAVLELAVSEMLYRARTGYREGELTRVRAAIVNEKGLALLARSIDLGRWLKLGKGEQSTGGAQKDSLLANAFEALLGAVFLDTGYESVARVVVELIRRQLKTFDLEELDQDYKTRLQEVAQMNFREKPKYKIVAEDGPDHDKLFRVEVLIASVSYGIGEAGSKKEAEQRAACRALEELANR